jgi:hypothetical protein
MTHGCSPFAVTRRNLTALDIITAHSVLPGREDVALLLEEAMRGEGWTGGRMEARRRSSEERSKLKYRQKGVRDDMVKALDVNPRWWGDEESDSSSTDSEDENEDDDLFVSVAVARGRLKMLNCEARHPQQIIHRCLCFHLHRSPKRWIL